MESPLREALEGRLDAAQAALVAAVAGLSDAEANRAPPSERWSIAGQVRHLVRSEKLFLWIFRVNRWRLRLPWRRAHPAPPLEEIADRLDFDYGTRKVKAPFFVRPPRGEQPPLRDLLASFSRVRAKTKRELDHLARRDARGVRFPHPLFGPLDGYQWMAVAALHVHHHVAAIEEARARGAGTPRR